MIWEVGVNSRSSNSETDVFGDVLFGTTRTSGFLRPLQEVDSQNDRLQLLQEILQTANVQRVSQEPELNEEVAENEPSPEASGIRNTRPALVPGGEQVCPTIEGNTEDRRNDRQVSGHVGHGSNWIYLDKANNEHGPLSGFELSGLINDGKLSANLFIRRVEDYRFTSLLELVSVCKYNPLQTDTISTEVVEKLKMGSSQSVGNWNNDKQSRLNECRETVKHILQQIQNCSNEQKERNVSDAERSKAKQTSSNRDNSGFRLFKCHETHDDGKECGRVFISRFALNKHISRIKTVKSYACTSCGTGFTRSDGLRRHMNEVHRPAK